VSSGKDAPTLVGAPFPAGAAGSPHVGSLHLRGAHVHHHLRGLHTGRLRSHRVLILFLIALIVTVGLGAAIVAVAAPSSAPLCQPFTPCGPPVMSAALVNQTVWRSSQYGFSIEYPGSLLSPTNQTGSGLTLNLQSNNFNGTIVVSGTPTTQASPAHAITDQLGSLPGISQISVDNNAGDQLLAPGVGYHTGTGGVYVGYQDASQGVGGEQAIYSESATDGRVTITVTVVSPSGTAPAKDPVAQVADSIINSVKWS
jgi:hypothetical protein